MTDDPFADLKKLRAPPLSDIKVERVLPEKIRKRRQQFVMLPLWWVDMLAAAPMATSKTYQLAIYLWHVDWKNHGRPFKLPNGMLQYDGISRQTKWRALRDLERRGLIRVECRDKKSPIIHLMRQPAMILIG